MAFFGLPGAEEEEDAGPDEQGTHQKGHKPFDIEHAQIFDPQPGQQGAKQAGNQAAQETRRRGSRSSS